METKVTPSSASFVGPGGMARAIAARPVAAGNAVELTAATRPRLGEEGLKAYGAMTALQRMADPAEVGAAAAFLASADSSFMTAWRATMRAPQRRLVRLRRNLGFSPIKLGGLSEGGLLVQARGNSWGRLIFRDVVQFD